MPGAMINRRNITFENDAIYLTGYAYYNCIFNNCTMVFNGAPFILYACQFSTCVWHLDVVVHDPEVWKILKEMLIPAIDVSLKMDLAKVESIEEAVAIADKDAHRDAPLPGFTKH